MSTPFMWIGIPIFMGVFLTLLSRWRRFVFVMGTLFTVVLAFLVRLVPFDSMIAFGPWSVQISDQAQILGLNFTLTAGDRSILFLLFSVATFLFVGTWVAKPHRCLAPYGLIILGLILAALSVDPFYFGSLFLLIAVQFCVLILQTAGVEINSGVTRFFIFQTIGAVFILLSGWFFYSDANLSENTLALTRMVVILGIGFGFLFGIVPFYTWVIMISEGSHPYTAVYCFSMVFGANTLYFLSLLEKFQWLMSSVDILNIFQIAGVLMIVTGGILAAFQRNLGRLLGYGVVIEIGRSLLSISLLNGNLHNALLIPRIMALSVWGLGLSVLKENTENLNFSTVQGMARHFRWSGAAVVLSHLSISGLPLLASFPLILMLWEEVVVVSIPVALWCFLGSLGFMAAGFRSLAVLVMGPNVLPWEEDENIFQRVYLFVGILFLFLLGIFPNWFYPWFSRLFNSLWIINP